MGDIGKVKRRHVLGGVLSLGAAGAVSAVAAGPVAATGGATARGDRAGVVLLGTAGGPGWSLTRPRRMGTSSAVVVGDRYYLVDAGSGVGHQLMRAGLGDSERLNPLSSLAAVFLTHLHSDHVCDLPNLLSIGVSSGLGQGAVRGPIPIWGPGDRGAVPIPRPGQPVPPVVNPHSPTPGTAEMVQKVIEAFATDYNDRAVDLGRPGPDRMFQGLDIPLPEPYGADPDGDPHPDMEPFAVFEDEHVRVSAILVKHAPVFPAYGFRFDTEQGSVVFSGDTGPSENLVKLAAGADILVHEVIASGFAEQRYPEPRTPAEETSYRHLIEAHTTEKEVGAVAEAAGVQRLVLNHLVPADWSPGAWRAAGRGFSGRLTVGADLDFIGFDGGRGGKG